MFLAAAALLLAAGASAQVKQGSSEVGVDVGLTVPTSDTTLGNNIPSTTLGSASGAFGVSYDYMAAKNVSVGGDFQYRNFANETVTNFHGGYNGTLSADDWTLLATGKYQFMPDNRIRPYALLGLGFGHADLTFNAPFYGATAGGTGFAYAFGAGAECDVNSQWAVGAELRWSGLVTNMNDGVGNQSVNSLDFLVSGRFKIGS
jgi:opacity protein-like surface antigen